MREGQIEVMLGRYKQTIADHFRIMGPTYDHTYLNKAKSAIDAASHYLTLSKTSEAMHLLGFIQGVMLCTGLHTWEYLTADERRL